MKSNLRFTVGDISADVYVGDVNENTNLYAWVRDKGRFDGELSSIVRALKIEAACEAALIHAAIAAKIGKEFFSLNPTDESVLSRVEKLQINEVD